MKFQEHTLLLRGGPLTSYGCTLIWLVRETEEAWWGRRWHPLDCKWQDEVLMFAKDEYRRDDGSSDGSTMDGSTIT